MRTRSLLTVPMPSRSRGVIGVLQAINKRNGSFDVEDTALSEGLAAIAAAQNEPERAGCLFGAAEALREAMGIPLAPVERPDYDRHVAALHAALGESYFMSGKVEKAIEEFKVLIELD